MMNTRLPLTARLLFRWHQGWYRATRGVVGHHVGRLRFLLLTTRGRVSGRLRTTPLLYGSDGDAFIIIASKGGLPDDPGWYRNLMAHPDVVIQVGSRHIRCHAHAADPEEKPRLWAMMVALYSGYADYQAKTERSIPVVILEPVRE